MQTTSSKALRSPAEEKPLSQKYLITEHFLPVRRMNTTLGAAIGAPLPPSVSHTGPCSALSCLRSFLPGRRPAPGGQSPSFLLVGSRDPLHAADPRARDSQESSHWWLAEARGWGGDGTRAGRNVWVPLASAPTGTPVGWGPGSPHLAAGTVLPAEQQQQDREQEEEDEQGDEPPEGARGAF